MTRPIRTIELAAWHFDEYKFRPRTFDSATFHEAQELARQRPSNPALNALCVEQTLLLRAALNHLQESRPDLRTEMLDLDWSLGVVDLRRLLAFQRRLSFRPDAPPMSVPSQPGWNALIDLAFAPPHPVLCDLVHDASTRTLTLQSSNPNVHLRVTHNPAAPIAVHAGSPFFEVAQYAGRWFLRDGYHRAYHLLRAGIFELPAVIVHARTLEELGANQPHFFSEAILLSEQPPFVSDFLDDALTIQYDRPSTITTLRLSMEESIAPTTSGEQP